MLFCSSAPVKTDHVDHFLAFIAFLCSDSPILLRPSRAVMATKSRHVSEVMATVQISVVAEERKGADPFLDLENAKPTVVRSKASVLRIKTLNNKGYKEHVRGLSLTAILNPNLLNE